MNRQINSEKISQLEEFIKEASNIVVVSHANPDGDAVGSLMGVYLFLKAQNKEVSAMLPDNSPEYLSFLDCNREILYFNESPSLVRAKVNEADLIIAVDFNSLSRVNSLEEVIAQACAKRVLIDHHPLPVVEQFDLVISDITCSSTCELIFWILEMLNFRITNQIASALYTGMMTDTNNFANSVTPQTFAMASKLLEYGIDKEKLQSQVFCTFSKERMMLMGHMLLNKLVVVEEYGAAYLILTLEEQSKFGYREGDSEGFVNLPLNIKGVSISALFTQKSDQIRVSLRSSNDFSVNQLSRLHFNGGGHERAAGGKLYISVDEIDEYFREALASSYNKCIG